MRTAIHLLACLIACGANLAAGQGCETPDAFEPNDACVAPATLSGGSFLGLTVQGLGSGSGIDSDYYRITVPPGHALQVDAIFANASGDVDLELFGNASCTQLVDASYSLSDDEHVDFVNSGASARILTLVVKGYGANFSCNDYDLLIINAPDPCNSIPADSAEDDDSCATAGPIFGGLTTGRNVSLSDPDWYRLTLDPGASMSFELRFANAQGDLDLRLWDTCPQLIGQTPIAVSESATDDEYLALTNTNATSLDVWIEVLVWSGSSSSCNDYEVFLSLDGGNPAIPLCFGDGTNGACPCGNQGAVGEGCSNSTGSGAVLTASGTNVHINDDLVLHVTGARPNQTGMAMQGMGFAPQLFRDGILCLGPPTERLEVLVLDSAGSAQTTVSIVQTGAVPGPGNTLYYQVWYRDPVVSVCGLGSNLSHALQVDWN